MKKYCIYHIPGIKIGCTSELEKRISDQGFTDYEILETHDDIYVASDREQELQRQYGYEVDRILYYESIRRRGVAGEKGGSKHSIAQTQHRSNIGKQNGGNSWKYVTAKHRIRGGKANAEKNDMSAIGKLGGNVEWHCTECDRIYKAGGAYGHRKATGHTITRNRNN